MIIDNRERNAELLDRLTGLRVEMTFAQLPVGDYVISDRMCVERKTVKDFEGSIMNARLFDQADRLSRGFGKPILLIEGAEADFTLAPNVILGTVVSLFADHNVQVIRSACADETAAVLAKLAEREQNAEERLPRIVGQKRAFTNAQWQALILGTIPGVGPKLAKSLLSRFRTISGVVAASEDELTEVDKVGKKKAKRIREILNAEFSEEGQDFKPIIIKT
ncbi:3'-flap repair endonuclease Xpf [uncultured archaeon]|nr:3'-flap repair endonuclease Xpf [uncultured archaeon]